MDEQTMKRIIEETGADYLGIQKMPKSVKNRPDMVMFNHPVTHSTLCVDVDKVTKQSIENKLRDHENKMQEHEQKTT